MDKGKIVEYGYKPGESFEADGRHSIVHNAIKNFENKDKEPRILAKVLYTEGKSRGISVYSESREKFISDVVNPLKEKLKLLDENFGEYVPPYYLEVGEDEDFDIYHSLDIPVTLYAYKVERADVESPAEQQLFEEQFKLFIKKSINFLKSQVESNSYPLLLPDIKLSNFIFGTHMGDSKKRLYFIDQYPPFLTAERVIQNLKKFRIEEMFPFMKGSVDDLYNYWEIIHEDTADYKSF